MIITNALTQRLPRWVIFALIAVYALPGLFARDPWRADDAIGFGLTASMAQGGMQHWAIPNVYGVMVAEKGPLGYWLGGLFGKVWLAVGGQVKWLDEVSRLSCVVWLILLAWALWETAFRLARRPELQPADPLGVAPSRFEYARTVADACVLALLATLGLLLRTHQQVAEIPELLGITLVLLAAARSLDRPIGAGWGLGLGLVVVLLARGWSHGLWMVAGLLLASLSHPTLKFGLSRRLSRALLVLVLVVGAWMGWVNGVEHGDQWLTRWINWNWDQFEWPERSPGQWLPGAWTYFTTALWFLWPAWPMALWAVYHFRKQLKDAALRIPVFSLAGGVIALPFLKGNSEIHLLPLIPPTLLLAALGMSTFRRALISLVDWFALMVFSGIAGLIWLGWSAITFGMPAPIARNFARLAPGFQAHFIWSEVAVAALACVVWALIVRWRITSHPRALWRAMVLSSSGTALVWLLLMTLWLPWINSGKTYAPVVADMTAVMRSMPSDATGCVATRNLGMAQRASFVFFGELAVRKDAFNRKNLKAEECVWLLTQDSVKLSGDEAFPNEELWEKVWEGSRAADKNERFRLYRRRDSAAHATVALTEDSFGSFALTAPAHRP